MPRICVNELDHHCFRQWGVAYSVPSHYLNQWWLIVNWTHRNTFSRSLDRNSIIITQENAFENVVCHNGGHLVQAEMGYNKIWEQSNSITTCWVVRNEFDMKRMGDWGRKVNAQHDVRCETALMDVCCVNKYRAIRIKSMLWNILDAQTIDIYQYVLICKRSL